MNESKFWTQTTTNEQTFNVNSTDGFTSISLTVSGAGADTTDIVGTLSLDGVGSNNILVAVGETITISSSSGNVLGGLVIVTASDNTTSLIGVQ